MGSVFACLMLPNFSYIKCTVRCRQCTVLCVRCVYGRNRIAAPAPLTDAKVIPAIQVD